jgi:hypothetical protein
MYLAIRSAAPNATIAVVGYPQVVPASSYVSCGGWVFTNSEQDAARAIGTALNSAISAAVSRAGSGFTYIDPEASGSPFLGHELCTTNPYFNGVSTPGAFSFHPNAGGEQAYADLIASYF